MAQKQQPGVKVVHSLPHRTRLRVPRSHRNLEQMSNMQKALLTAKGVQSVHVNQATGSFLIEHSPEGNMLDNLSEVLHEASGFLPIFAGELAGDGEGTSELAGFMQNALSGVDDKVARATNNLLDLKMIVPLTLGYFGVRKLIQTGNLLGEVSPFVMLYYAFDSYWKLHKAHPIAEANPTVRDNTGQT